MARKTNAKEAFDHVIKFTQYDKKWHKLRNTLKTARIHRIHKLVMYDMSLIYKIEMLTVPEEYEDKEDYMPHKSNLGDYIQPVNLSYPGKNVLCT